MHFVHRQLLPPSSVDFCLEAHFTGKDHVNLIVGRGAVLEVYRLRTGTSKTNQNSAWLGLVCEKKLFGKLNSLCKIRPKTSSKDILVMGFDRSKVSYVEYNENMHDLKTVSLHDFQKEDIQNVKSQLGRVIQQSKPKVVVDPQNRCTASIVANSLLSVIPTRQTEEGLEGGSDDEDATEMHSTHQVGWSDSTYRYFSPPFIISLDQFGISNIKDVSFLDGYYEPTLIVLYEKRGTPSPKGRPTRTCAVKALTLDLIASSCTEIWNQENLPYDSWSVYAVDSPVGGVLIVSTNALFHIDQSHFYCLVVNLFGTMGNEEKKPYAYHVAPDVNISLDDSQVVFLSPVRPLLSLKNGNFYIAYFQTEGTHVSNIRLAPCGTSVPPSCMTRVGDEHFLLASQVADSLLIKYQIQQKEASLSVPVPQRKRHKGQPPEESVFHDEEALLLFGDSSELPDDSMDRYQFSVSDSLFSICPIADFAIAHVVQDQNLEVVGCCGHGRSGALFSIGSGVRHTVMAQFPLANVLRYFLLHLIPEAAPGTTINEFDASQLEHNYLLLTQNNQTLILETGDQLKEVGGEADVAGFFTRGPTLNAGNIFNGTRVVQIHRNGIRLTDGHQSTQNIKFPKNMTIQSSAIEDPHVLVVTDTNEVIIYEAQPMVHLLTEIQRVSLAPLASVTLFKDVGGTPMPLAGEKSVGLPPRDPSMEIKPLETESSGIYNSTPVTSLDDIMKPPDTETLDPPVMKEDVPHSVDYPHPFVVLTYTTGAIEIYSLPFWQLVFNCADFGDGPEIVADMQDKFPRYTYTTVGNAIDGMGSDDDEDQHFVRPSVMQEGVGRTVVEARLIHLPSSPTDMTEALYDVYLVALLSTGDVFVYRAYERPTANRAVNGRLQCRFRRQAHDMFPISRPTDIDTSENSGGQSFTFPPVVKFGDYTFPSIIPFMNIGGKSGFFLCGLERSVWGFRDRGAIRMQPVEAPLDQISIGIPFMAPFHNANCPRGFLTYGPTPTLNVCCLDPSVRSDSSKPIKKIMLRVTPHYLAYHPTLRLFGVATSQPTNYENAVKQFENLREAILPEDAPDPFDFFREGLPLTTPAFQLRLYEPGFQEMLDSYDFGPFEEIMCLQPVNLRMDSASVVDGGRKILLAVGTALVKDEDTACLGRIFLFDISDSVLTGGHQKQLNLLQISKLERNNLEKGPITAVSDVNGNLAVAMGQKIMLYSFLDGEKLVGVGYYDSFLQSTILRTMKNYILFGDVIKSLTLLQWKPENRSLTMLSREKSDLGVTLGDFIVDQNDMGMVALDQEENIVVFGFNPKHPETSGGLFMLRLADFHLGTYVCALERIFMRTPVVTSSNDTRALQWSDSHAVLYGSVDGSIGYVAPISEDAYRRLSVMYEILAKQVPQCAGLNPIGHRACRGSGGLPQPDLKKNIVDGDLLWRFSQLPLTAQRDFSRKLGTDPHQIMENIGQIHAAVNYF